ncbi:MAG: metal-dependent transcriptional regulator [Deltaproteobacteria bacterium]
MSEDKARDEVLEFIWTQREQGFSSIKGLLALDEVSEARADIKTIEEMQRDGLVRIAGDVITLTQDGDRHAETAIRRHRLAERLLTEVLAVDDSNLEKDACSFEHTLSPAVTDSICTLLGHPPTCPHGLAIPRGRCCLKTASGLLKPIVTPLDELALAEPARIVFILSKSNARLDKLTTLGIVPGSVIVVTQKRPAFVIQIGETTLALDPEIVREIYVKKTS